MRTNADKSKWSKSSRRSGTTTGYYEDIEYHCRKCNKKAVYSARDQKQDFEVKKLYVWARRILCPNCNSAKYKIESRLRDYQERWPSRKRELQDIANFAAEWLRLVEDHASYGAQKDYAAIKMLRRISEVGRKRRMNGRGDR